ncbi:MAG: DotU family type IV/VI secretion system protein [Planctomycetes bacterium]|nr:DotU family type IV/VI secretion system protein [Planctomycetota bacterium]
MSKSSASLSLLDACLPIVVYLSWLTEGTREEDAVQVRTRFEILFRELDPRAQAMGYSQEEVRFTMFALVTAIDERLMIHEWPGRSTWFREPLQLAFFDTNAAGEEFYQRLEQVQERMSDGRIGCDVLEVYHAMLSMGLQGQLGSTLVLRKQREELIITIGEQLMKLRSPDHRASGGDVSALSGNALRRKIWMPPVVFALLCFLALCVAWIWLGSASADAVSVLQGGS